MSLLIDKAWKPSKDKVWTLNEIEEIDFLNDTVAFKNCDDGDTAEVLPLKAVHMFDPSHSIDIDNVMNMNNIHEAPLVHLLNRRYMDGKPFTFTGEILISINPFETLVPGLVNCASKVDIGPEAPPCLETLSGRILQRLLEKPESHHAVIINGESGAGKTEASKSVIRFLSAQDKGQSPVLDSVTNFLVDTNLLLELFGNAKTERNDNSSRFGKYIQLSYSNQHLTKAYISYFLLETSRLVYRSELERNFHVFYALCQGATNKERELLGGLNKWNDYKYLKGPGPSSNEESGFSWNEIKRLLRVINVEEEKITQLMFSLKAILELGNIVVSEHEISNDDVSNMTFGQAKQNLNVANIDPNDVHLLSAAKCLGLEPNSFLRALLGRMLTINVSNPIVEWVEISKAQCEDAINSLSKAIYSRIFDWLVSSVNGALESSTNVDTSYSKLSGSLGILDIYGFEILSTNSLEQLCINFANERLQRQFNEKVFVAERERYHLEGVFLDNESFVHENNQPCIDLIGSSKLSIFSLLDDQTTILHHSQGVARLAGNDEQRVRENQLISELDIAFAGKHPNYRKPRFKDATFMVRHFAGTVTYNVRGFPKKNLDILPSDIVGLIQEENTLNFVKELFWDDTEKLLEEQQEKFEDRRRRVFVTNSFVESGLDNRPQKKQNFKNTEKPLRETLCYQSNNSLNNENSSLSNNVDTASVSSKVLSNSQRSFTNCTRNLGKERTLGRRFKQQLNSLIHILNNCTPHYVRCIKPNDLQAPKLFDFPLVVQQLRYIGILEAVRIRQFGFPIQKLIDEFLDEMAILNRISAGEKLKSLSPNDQTSILLKHFLGEGTWKVGENSVFLKNKQLEKLQGILHELKKKAAIKIQAVLQRNIAEKAIARIKEAEEIEKKKEKSAVLFQKMWRGHRDRGVANNIRATMKRNNEAAVTIQSMVRAINARKKLEQLRETARIEKAKNKSAITIQRIARGYSERKVFAKRLNAALKINRTVFNYYRNKTLARRLSALHTAAAAGDRKKLQSLCEEAVSKGYVDELAGVRAGRGKLQSLLHACVTSGNVDVVDLVLKKNSTLFKLNGQMAGGLAKHFDSQRNTSLHLAAKIADHEKSMTICSYLIDAVSTTDNFNDQDLKNDDFQIANSSDSSVLKGVLFKRRAGSKFLERRVIVDTLKGTLSYIRGGLLNSSKTVRFVFDLNEDTDVQLRVTDMFPNTFEITSSRLKTHSNPLGMINFKCSTQIQAQKWITKIRSMEGVTFVPAVELPSSVHATKWAAVTDLVCRTNKFGQTALHFAAGVGGLVCCLFFTALVSGKGAVPVISLLTEKDINGLTAKMHAEKSKQLIVQGSLDRLLTFLKHGSPFIKRTKQMSQSTVLRDDLDSFMRVGNTYVSFFLSELRIPIVSDLKSVSLVVSIINHHDWEEKAINSSSNSATPSTLTVSPIVEADLAEDQVVLRPFYWDKESSKTSILYYGAMWNMQLPLEQVSHSGATVVVQIKNENSVVGLLIIPINRYAVGQGNLTAGYHKFPVVSCSMQAKESFLSRTLHSIRSRGNFGHLGSGGSGSHASKSSRKDIHSVSDLASNMGSYLTAKVHFYTGTDPGLNCSWKKKQ